MWFKLQRVLLLVGEKELKTPLEGKPEVLFVDNNTRDEALKFQQKMTDYQSSSPLYKDEKALSILDR